MNRKKTTPETEALIDERDKLHDIKALVDTPGGKQLADLLTRDILANMRKIANDDTYPPAAALNANMNLLALILNAEENEKAVEEMIAEALNT